jgi:N-acetylmuramoyl-L-alanine amidase
MRQVAHILARTLLLAVVALLAAGATPAGNKDRDLYVAAKKEYDVIAKTKPTAQTRGRWEKLGERLEKFALDFPRSAYADDALYHAGKVYDELHRFDRRDISLTLAIKSWRALLARYPKSPFAPEGRYRLADNLEGGMGDVAEARKEYLALAENYPKSEWGIQARKRLDALNARAKAEAEKKEQARAPASGGKALLSQIRHTSSPSYTRVTMELSSEVRYEAHVLEEDAAKGLPPRIYVDLQNSRLGLDPTRPIAVQDGLLRQMRAAQFSPDVVRVVLDMSSLTEYRTFLLPDPYRLVVDIQGKENGEKPTTPEKRPELVSLPRSKKPAIAGLRKIVLDPGHGGKDPGAVGANGLAEKDIVLSVARKLAEKLRRELGVEVVLTRKDDTFIALEDRTAIANAERADLFISIHVNASPNAEARGLETYYLNNTDDEAAIRLAARENATSRKNVTDLQFTLSDLTQNLKLEDSISLAHRLQGSLVSQMSQRYGEVRDLGVKQALFYVLVGARMPSVLVEAFFVTNRSDARALGKEAYLDDIADALLAGIKKYSESAQVAKRL